MPSLVELGDVRPSARIDPRGQSVCVDVRPLPVGLGKGRCGFEESLRQFRTFDLEFRFRDDWCTRRDGAMALWRDRHGTAASAFALKNFRHAAPKNYYVSRRMHVDVLSIAGFAWPANCLAAVSDRWALRRSLHGA